MSKIKLPDSFIHPRSNQPAKGHAGRMAEVKFYHIFKQYIDKNVRWATRDENIYKKFDIASSIKDYGKMDIKAELYQMVQCGSSIKMVMVNQVGSMARQII